MPFCKVNALRDAGTGVHGGAMGEQVPLHNSIIGNFMVYQDRLETSFLQLFAHTENSEWFSIISAIIFEVNIL